MIGQRRRVRRLYVALCVMLVVSNAVAILWGRAHGAREYARGAADVVLYAAWVGDSTWAAHLSATVPHWATMPDGQGGTVRVIFSRMACLAPRPKTARLP